MQTIQLTQDQIDFFHREGYLTLPAITNVEELAKIRDIYDRLFAERAGRAEGNQFDLAGSDEEDAVATLPQILGPSRYAPELNDFLFKKNAKAVADQELGCGIALGQPRRRELQIGQIRGERRLGEIAAAGPETREVESHHTKPLGRQASNEPAKDELVLRTGKAVGDEGKGAHRASGKINSGGNSFAATARKRYVG